MLICALGALLVAAALLYSIVQVALFMVAITVFPYVVQRVAGGVDAAELRLSCMCGSRVLALQVVLTAFLFQFTPLSVLSIWAGFAITFITAGRQ